jgi:hypothetical protein
MTRRNSQLTESSPPQAIFTDRRERDGDSSIRSLMLDVSKQVIKLDVLQLFNSVY